MMSYTPLEMRYGNMKMTLQLAPFKSAGQGFSIAPLFMDLLIKFDAETLTGYGLRIMRTTKYGTAVDFLYVKYVNGQVVDLSEPISSSCYRTTCTIALEYRDGRLVAHASTDARYNREGYAPGVVPVVDLETDVSPNDLGGFGIWYNGGASTLIKDLRVEWE